MKYHLLTLVTTFLLAAAMVTLPARSEQMVSGYKIPNKAFTQQCVANDNPQALIDEFVRINNLGSDYSVEVAWSSSKQEALTLEKSAINAVPPPSSTAVVICVAIVVGGIVIYVLYRIIKKLDRLLTNSELRTNLNEEIITER